ncbi:MAG: hypothetical protein NW201_09695 [Gemmatimonadales bacterium]|nr:hypothetical protein [Gemmatimonadales bacterium]
MRRALLAALLLAPAPAAAQEVGRPDPDQAVLVELRAGDAAVRTVEAFRRGDEALLPLLEVLELCEVGSPERLRTGRLRLLLQPAGPLLFLDVTIPWAARGARVLPITYDDVALDGERVFVGARLLGALLDTELQVDWTTVTVALARIDHLPLGRRLAREAFAVAGLAPPPPPLEPELRRPLDRRSVGGAVLDYQWFLPSGDPLGGGTLQLAAGANAFGGALDLGLQSSSPLGEGRFRATASWLGTWRDGRYLRQLRLGDGIATGLRGTPIRGVAATNAPFLRPVDLGTLDLVERLPAGWQAQFSQAGRLVAFDTVPDDGRARARVPLLFGENPVEVAAFGPAGEERRFTRTLVMPGSFLPARRVEYGVALGQCRFGACDAALNADLRWAPSRRATLQAGLDRFWRGGGRDLTHPYALAALAPAAGTVLELEHAHDAFTRAAATWTPSTDLRVAVEGTRFAPGVADPLITAPFQRHRVALTGFWRPNPARQLLFVTLQALSQTTVAATFQRARLDGTIDVGNARITPYWRLDRTLQGGVALANAYTGVTAFAPVPAAAGPFLARGAVRAGLELADTRGLFAWSADWLQRLSRTIGLELGATWTRGNDAPFLRLVVTTFLPQARGVTAVQRAPGGGVTATQSVFGAVVLDPTLPRADLVYGPATQRGGLRGRVFLDRDADGTFGPGDSALAGVRVQVGAYARTTGADGRYRAWDLVAFEPTRVALDTVALQDPTVAPALRLAEVAVNPNRYTTLDLPVVRTGVLEGRVEAPGPAGGVPLLLVEAGGRRESLTTFGDGGFLLIGVRPGRYTLGATPEALAALGLVGDRTEFTVAADGTVTPATVTLSLRRAR